MGSEWAGFWICGSSGEFWDGCVFILALVGWCALWGGINLAVFCFFHLVSLGSGLGVYFRVGIFPPSSPPPTVNFAVGICVFDFHYFSLHYCSVHVFLEISPRRQYGKFAVRSCPSPISPCYQKICLLILFFYSSLQKTLHPKAALNYSPR